MPKGDDLIFDTGSSKTDQASDTLLHAIDIIECRLMEFAELRQTIGKDFMFYLQINLRKLKDDQENDACRSG